MTYECESGGKVWSVSTLFFFKRTLWLEDEALDYHPEGDYYTLPDAPERRYRLRGSYFQGYTVTSEGTYVKLVRPFSVLDYLFCLLPFLMLFAAKSLLTGLLLGGLAAISAVFSLIWVRVFDHPFTRIVCCLGVGALFFFAYYLLTLIIPLFVL